MHSFMEAAASLYLVSVFVSCAHLSHHDIPYPLWIPTRNPCACYLFLKCLPSRLPHLYQYCSILRSGLSFAFALASASASGLVVIH